MKRNEWPIGRNIERIPDEEPEILDEQIRDEVAEIVDGLSEEYRRIIEMRQWERMPFRKIAEELGYKSHASILNKYAEALEIIRSRLGEDYPDNLD